ncbi:discoidin domain-containing protein [Catenulispora rubra]|uniref:discoidin domain-containing protein n=1 Tax=Catenulispora rubra TaxID=280293 RepID=UPI0018925667|nr:discoidin domain-containing protein [Catenulispora rubra]
MRSPSPAPLTRQRGKPATALAVVLALLLAALFGTTAGAHRAAAASCGTTNLALNAPATASSLENATLPASAAVDGNTGTRWSSQFSDPQWLQVDLGSVQNICQVSIQWETASAKAYQIQVSNDASTWTSIYSTTTGPGGTENLTVSGSGRYIRMYGTARNTAYGYSVWEFQVFGSSGGSTCGTTDAALNHTATASSLENATLPASNAVDGNLGTRWSSQFSDPQWLQVDLGATRSICGVQLAWETASAKAYQIQTSNDGSTWTSVYSTTTGPGGTENLTVSGSGRYIRMYGTARNTAYGYSLWEFSVFTTGGSTGNTVTVNNPGNQSTAASTAVNLQIQATDSASGQTLTYGASGLPAGLSISSSGLITGTPTATGTSTVTVTATDGTGASGSTSFTWTVGGSGGNGGAPPPAFWGNTSAIPTAQNVLEFAIVNQTNGQYPDSQVFWSFNGTTKSIAQQPYIDMPANSAGRMYFYLGTPNGQYYDFIEFTVGTASINVDTTRVDRFGLKLALKLHAHDGSDQQIGENYATFQESRSATFSRFQSSVPTEFKELATDQAPFGIPSPGNDPAFQTGGAYANYFQSYAAANGDTADSTAQIFGCGGTLANNPPLCAGLNRHVAQLPAAQQSNPANFYQAAPANYYAQFWHQNAINGAQYGFPYDDDAGQSSDISVTNPQYAVVAVGW